MAHYSPGRYECEVVGQGFGNSKEKRTPYFFLKVRPLARIVSADEREFVEQPYERDIVMYLTDKTVEGVVGKLRHHLEWDGSDWSELDPESGSFDDLRRKVIEASCEHEVDRDDESRVYERWQLPPVGGGLSHERDATTVRSVQAMFGAALKGGKPKAKPKAQKPASEPVAVSTRANDDIPF